MIEGSLWHLFFLGTSFFEVRLGGIIASSFGLWVIGCLSFGFLGLRDIFILEEGVYGIRSTTFVCFRVFDGRRW